MGYLRDRILAILALDPQGPAIDFNDRWISWGELARSVASLLDHFDRLSLPPGAAIGCIIRNRPQAVAMMLAATAGDRCILTLNAMYPDDKLAEDIVRMKPPVVLAVSSDWARPAVREAVASIGAAGIELTEDWHDPVRMISGLETKTGAVFHPPVPDVAIYMLSSGTTGTPKRIPLKVKDLEASQLEALQYEKGRNATDKPALRSGIQIIQIALVHIGGMWAVYASILAGRKIALLEKFSVAGWRKMIVRHRPRLASLPPAALRMVMDADVPKEDLASLVSIRTGTAPLDPALAEAMEARYGIAVLQSYGATEFAGAVAGWTYEDWKAFGKTRRGSVGRLHAGVEGRIVDAETGVPLALGAEGLLELRSPHLGGGKSWLRTTDRAVLDADGFLWIKGRADNVIIRGGFKVQPDEVAAVLQTHPAVREACVVGIDDLRLGQVPVAAVILKEGVNRPTADELKDWARAKLLAYQVPVSIRIVDDVPRTPSMKPAAPAIREMFMAEAR